MHLRFAVILSSVVVLGKKDLIYFSTTTTTISPTKPTPENYNNREVWDVYFSRPASLYAPLQITGFNARTGDVDLNYEFDGWHRDYLIGKSYRGSETVGFPQVQGNVLESSSFLKLSSAGFTEVLKESFLSEVFCRGARHIRSFFGSAYDRTVKHRPDDAECIRKCENVAGRSDLSANVSRKEIIEDQDLMQSCSVPLTHLIRGKFMKVVATDSPTASLQLPHRIFEVAGIYNRDDLAEFLIQVNVTACPPRLLASGEVTVGADIPLEDNRDTSGPAWIATRPWENPLDEFDFTPSSSRETPKFKIAPSVHYSTYELSAFGVSNILGATYDSPVVVRMPSTQQYLLDLAPFIRRIWDTEHFEFSLLSSCAILGVNELFTFRRVTNWMYRPESSSCAAKQTCDQCREAGCTWCRKRATGDDFLDKEWSQISNPNIKGRCGVSEDVCVAHYGKIGSRNICYPASQLES